MRKSADHLRLSFAALLHSHRRILFKVAALYAQNPEDRRDLAQEISAQLWRAYPRFDPQRRFSTWMYRIALNVGISHLRSATGRAVRFAPLDADWAETLAAPEPEDDDRLRQLYAFIGGLDALHRALMLLYLDDHSYAEIAAILGITETNVATRVSRIKQQLRARAQIASSQGA
jgi:RNA polymerase sigma factor (sigma-70 family)